MARLPIPGQDDGTWGDVLNDYLLQAHTSAGALKPDAVSGSALQDDSVTSTTIQDGSITSPKLSASGGVTGDVLIRDTGVSGGIKWDTVGGGGAPSGAAGGDLGGTYPNPTVPGLAGKEPTITATTSADYYRGDKTFQPLNKTAVGLSNVDNTSDANKPVSSATTTALNAKVTANGAITGGTNTKITYDTKGLVTAGAAATQDDIGDGTTNKQYSATEKTKLAGIATGATANSSDATLLNRTNHTGTQTASTISDFNTAADARIAAASINALADVVITTPANGEVLKYNGTNWVNGTDATGGVTDGDKGDITVTGSGATWTIDAAAVTGTKIANTTITDANISASAAIVQSKVQNLTTDLASKAAASTTVTAGTGLTGGGDLSANRTISANFGTTTGTIAQGDDSRITGAEQTSNKGVANGYASLSASTRVPTAQLGFGVANNTVYLRGDGGWASAPVTTVAGRTGAIVITEADVTNLTSDLAARTTVTNGGGETYFDAGNSGTAKTLNLANGNVQKLTLTGNCTITLTGPSTGAYRSMLLYVFQDGTGSRTITWPGSVSWGTAGAPTLSTAASKMDKILLDTVDGGTTWYGAVGPGGY